jgi:UDP-N-acetylmuramyl pentapeptide phosphotransferase/UDP-N-acetylglucosamine-1-phosphate transferase
MLLSGFSMYLVTSIVFMLFRRFGIVDKPHLYPHEEGRGALPYPGGVVMIINMILWSPWILQAIAEADFKKGVYVIVA